MIDLFKLPERFFNRISPEPISGCWIWDGSRNELGYGLYCTYDNSGIKRNRRVHRFTYEFFNGPIKYGLQIDHLCRNTSCCNPSHLEPVTAEINIRRGNGISSKNAKKTHCIKGHSLTDEENVKIAKVPYTNRFTRVCITCSKERYIKSYAKQVYRRRLKGVKKMMNSYHEKAIREYASLRSEEENQK